MPLSSIRKRAIPPGWWQRPTSARCAGASSRWQPRWVTASPAALGDGLLLLIEGAYVSGQLFGEGGPAGALPEIADRLIEASLGRKARKC